MITCRAVPGGVRLSVHVIPRARAAALAGTRDGALLIRLTAPPVDDAANRDLVTFVATGLGVPARAVRIVSGERSRRKAVEIEGVDVARVTAWLAESGPSASS